jgi:HAD superfamily hydrolase (TIGR01509 family)
LRGLLFDFDGLILDTETTIHQAWSEKFKEYGKELLLEEWGQILGKAGDQLGPLEGFLDEFPSQAEREQIKEEVSRREYELVLKQDPLPGAEELIKKASAAELKMGIVSSSEQKWVHDHLERLGLMKFFDHTSCADDVEEAKPNPELYHLGLRKTGLDADQVVVLEDSPNGVLAAKRAGLFCIAVPNKLTSQLTFYNNGGKPDLFLKSLQDFPWDEFLIGQ